DLGLLVDGVVHGGLGMQGAQRAVCLQELLGGGAGGEGEVAAAAAFAFVHQAGGVFELVGLQPGDDDRVAEAVDARARVADERAQGVLVGVARGDDVDRLKGRGLPALCRSRYSGDAV